MKTPQKNKESNRYKIFKNYHQFCGNLTSNSLFLDENVDVDAIFFQTYGCSFKEACDKYQENKSSLIKNYLTEYNYNPEKLIDFINQNQQKEFSEFLKENIYKLTGESEFLKLEFSIKSIDLDDYSLPGLDIHNLNLKFSEYLVQKYPKWNKSLLKLEKEINTFLLRNFEQYTLPSYPILDESLGTVFLHGKQIPEEKRKDFVEDNLKDVAAELLRRIVNLPNIYSIKALEPKFYFSIIKNKITLNSFDPDLIQIAKLPKNSSTDLCFILKDKEAYSRYIKKEIKDLCFEKLSELYLSDHKYTIRDVTSKKIPLSFLTDDELGKFRSSELSLGEIWAVKSSTNSDSDFHKFLESLDILDKEK